MARSPSYAFEFHDGPIGSYSSVGLGGTRSAAPIAAAWSVMRYLGRDAPIERIAAALVQCGWFVRTMANPPTIHMGMITLHQGPATEAYLSDVAAVVAEARK